MCIVLTGRFFYLNLKKIAAAAFLAASMMLPLGTAFATQPFEALPEDIFQWVQSTPRTSYYFNKQAMTYEIGPDGYADTNVLLVPVVYLYDDMEIKDVTMKRQWMDLSTYRFNELIGSSELLRIDLTKKTVQHSECTFLDQGYNSLYAYYERGEEDMNSMSQKNVDYEFYQAIISYEQKHRTEIMQNIADKLRPEDLKKAGLQSDDKAADSDKKSARHSRHKR